MSRRFAPWIAPAIVALLALAACVTSIGHDFTLDDRYTVQLNEHVHTLHGMWRLFGQTYWPEQVGGDGYRPLVVMLFALQWAAGGGAPWVFHLMNIVLAAAAAVSVYWCARSMLDMTPAAIAAALFAVHPVHVEVTGNIVGQSELLVATVLCLAVGIYIRARRHGALGPREAGAVLALYVLGLLAKEHAFVLPALLAAVEVTVVRDAGTRWSRPMRVFGLLLIAISAAYVLVLDQVHQNIAGFVPFPVFQYLRLSALDRAFTMMAAMPRIARLLVFPTHLSGDYSPTEVAVTRGFDVIQLPGLFICIGVVLLAFVLRRRAPVVSLGLFWTIIAFLPASNLLLPAGFMMAERTLFFPSVGVVLIAGSIAEHIRAHGARRERLGLAAAAGVLLALGLGRSIERQRVWKNNDVFFDALVKDAPNSYRAHFMRARLLADEHRYAEMEGEYHRAIALFPYDVTMMLQIASDYFNSGQCAPVIPMLRWTYAVDSTTATGRVAYVQCLMRQREWAEARTQALAALRSVQPSDVRPLRAVVALADSALGRGHRARTIAEQEALQSARHPANYCNRRGWTLPEQVANCMGDQEIHNGTALVRQLPYPVPSASPAPLPPTTKAVVNLPP